MANLDSLSGTILRDATGAPYTGAKAYYWSDVGATVPLSTYSNASLSSANTQPVVADGTTGAFGSIYLTAARYWRTVTTSAGVSLPQFNLGPIDALASFLRLTAAPSPTYPFLRYANSTDGHTYRRNAADSAWIDEGLTDSLLNSASVTEQLTGTATDKASTPDSVAALWQRGTDIASASSLSLPSTGGGTFNVTGTTTITGISSAQGGREVELTFAAACQITHNATSMILPGAANYITHAGEILKFRNEAAADASGSNWRLTKITPASSPINASTVLTKTANYTIVAADKSKLIAWTISSATTATLPAANAVNSGAAFHIINEVGSTVETALTIARAGSDTIDNALTSRIIYPGQQVTLVSNGSNKWITRQGQYYYFSGNQTITSAGALTLAHGLGIRPSRFWIALRNTTAEGNYSIGDVVPVGFTHVDATQFGASVVADATNLNVRFGSSGSVFQVPNKTTGAVLSITNGSWAALFYATY